MIRRLCDDLQLLTAFAAVCDKLVHSLFTLLPLLFELPFLLQSRYFVFIDELSEKLLFQILLGLFRLVILFLDDLVRLAFKLLYFLFEVS